MIPVPFAAMMLGRAVARARQRSSSAAQRQAVPPATAAIKRLSLSPLQVHLASPPQMRGLSAVTQDQGQGVVHPTPQEVAEAASKAASAAKAAKSEAQAQAVIAQAKAQLQAILDARAAWQKTHPRPGPKAQPKDIADWLNATGMSPRLAYANDWDWRVVQKGPPLNMGGMFPNLGDLLFEPGEAVTVVNLGDPHDNVTWYVHPSGSWSYHHVWGEDFGQLVGDVVSAIGSVVSDVAQTIAKVKNAVSTVLRVIQTAASFVPGLGTVVNEVVTAAEAALDYLSGDSALQIAIESAYNSLLASVPGLESIGNVLDPAISAVVSLAGSKGSVPKAALQAAINQAPDQPNIAGYSPRSIVAGFAGWVATKLGVS